jgi:hypothetical protein
MPASSKYLFVSWRAENMKTIKTIIHELVGLSVDDGNLSLAIPAVLVMVALLAHQARVDMSQAAKPLP